MTFWRIRLLIAAAVVLACAALRCVDYVRRTSARTAPAFTVEPAPSRLRDPWHPARVTLVYQDPETGALRRHAP